MVCLSQLNERFQGHNATAYSLSLLIPTYCSDSEITERRKAAEHFTGLLPGGIECLDAEILRWKSYWARQSPETQPNRVLNALSVSEKLGTYPVISTLFRIFATLPVTTATGERSFSALKLIKTFLRSTMTEQRLHGLSHLFFRRI